MTFTVKTFDELVTEMKINLVNNVDEINDLNVGAVIDTVISTFGNSLEGLYEDLNVVYEGSRISTATETDLDELGSLVGLTRSAGVKSTGVVTFKASASPGANITILENSQISTQPNTTETQLVFNVLEDTVFYDTITDESHLFLSGNYDYKLNQRFINTITTLTATSGGGAETLVENTDFEIIKTTDSDYDTVFDGEIISNADLVSFNDCDDKTEGTWVRGEEVNTAALDDYATEHYQGTSCLTLGTLNPTTEMEYTYTKDSTIDASDLSAFTYLFIRNSTVLSKIVSVKIEYASDVDFINSIYRTFSDELVAEEWNKLELTVGDSYTSATGNFDDARVKYFRITVTMNAGSEISGASGDILLDNLFFSSYEIYTGDIIRFDKDSAIVPDNNTNFLTTYKPLSVEVNAEAVKVGSEYNVAAGKVVYKISPFPGITSIYNYETFTDGLPEETDDIFRTRVQEASELTNVATVSAIRNNVLSLPAIKTCSIIDMPEKETLGETHIYNDGTAKFRLMNLSPIAGSIIVYDISRSNVLTDLDGGIDDDDMVITLTDSSSFPDYGIVKIDDELIYYDSKDDGTNTLNVGTLLDGTTTGRAHNGTTAAAHLNEADVNLLSYIEDTDFELNDYFEVEFKGIDDPTNEDVLLCDYLYEAVGFFNVYVTGLEGELTASQLETVDDLVDSIRSAGIQYEVLQPDYVSISSTIDITLEDGYLLSDVDVDIKTAVSEYINSLDIGYNVLLSKIIQAVFTIEGVSDVEITAIAKDAVPVSPVANVTVGDDEKAVSTTALITVGVI
jgi:uncharacterized phage protein gp47/JayE